MHEYTVVEKFYAITGGATLGLNVETEHSSYHDAQCAVTERLLKRAGTRTAVGAGTIEKRFVLERIG